MYRITEMHLRKSGSLSPIEAATEPVKQGSKTKLSSTTRVTACLRLKTIDMNFMSVEPRRSKGRCLHTLGQQRHWVRSNVASSLYGAQIFSAKNTAILLSGNVAKQHENYNARANKDW